MSPDAPDSAPPRKETTARVVRAGPLQDLSDDPVERYQHHFILLIERNFDAFDRPVTALDLACGVGTSTLTLVRKLPPGSRVVAISEDRAEVKIFHEQLTKEQRRFIFPRKEKRERLPFAPGIFDVTWATLAHERLRPPRPMVRAALRVLRPGGLLLLTAPLRATFGELVKALGPSLTGHESHPAFAALIAEPPDLLGGDAWLADMKRCGAIDVEVKSETIEMTLTPPLSRQPVFTQNLLPIWIGNNEVLLAQALRLLDETVKAPLNTTVHIGCIRGRRGTSDIEDSSIG